MTESSGYSPLSNWWRERVEDEISKTVPKAEEYGSGDLAEIGAVLRRLGVAKGDTSDTELGIFFYLVGKIARWEQAIQDGRRTSDDTLFDIGVYLKMAQRTRDVGGWPWGAAETSEPVEPEACGEGWEGFVCVAADGHDGPHVDTTGCSWGNPVETQGVAICGDRFGGCICSREPGHLGIHEGNGQVWP